MTSAHQSN